MNLANLTPEKKEKMGIRKSNPKLWCHAGYAKVAPKISDANRHQKKTSTKFHRGDMSESCDADFAKTIPATKNM